MPGAGGTPLDGTGYRLGPPPTIRNGDGCAIADLPLIALAAMARRAHGLVAATVLGMALGGVAAFGLGAWDPEAARGLMDVLPLVPDGQIDAARDMLADHGIAAFAIQPFSGVPFKLLALEGEARDMSWVAMPVSIGARGLRMAAAGFIAFAMGRAIRRHVERRFRVALVSYCVVAAMGWWLVTFG